ncbi:hypothetical protein G8767_20825 [Rhodococcus sp. IC4_135]|uniref:hypothetical protein n=1 Tax=Rhodococcus sp. IC4_135 TaxID=2715537 RepID=UPI00142147CE|nr:hypothetical protein [Rhodococcus sp. IC4_135]
MSEHFVRVNGETYNIEPDKVVDTYRLIIEARNGDGKIFTFNLDDGSADIVFVNATTPVTITTTKDVITHIETLEKEFEEL